MIYLQLLTETNERFTVAVIYCYKCIFKTNLLRLSGSVLGQKSGKKPCLEGVKIEPRSRWYLGSRSPYDSNKKT